MMSGRGETRAGAGPRRRSRIWRGGLLLFALTASCFPGFIEWRPARIEGVARPELFAVPETAADSLRSGSATGPQPAPSSPESPWAPAAAGQGEILLSLPGKIDHPSARGPLRGHLLAAGRRPARGRLLVLPTLGGRYTVSRLLAERLAKRGWEVLRLERRGPLIDHDAGITAAREALRGAVIDARLALGWMQARDPSDRRQIGVVGVSAGAIVAALVTGLDDRVGGAAWVLGGGNLAEMVMSAAGTGLARLRRNTAERRPALLPRLPELLHELLEPVDPLLYAGRLPPERILMVNGLFDRIVPRRCYMALWEAWGHPPLYELPTGHFLSVLFLADVIDRIDRHFEGIAALRRPPPER